MAAITLNIPGGVVSRVLEAISINHGFTGFDTDGTTPITKQEFSKKYLIKVLINEVSAYESQQAAYAASQTAIENVQSQIIIT